MQKNLESKLMIVYNNEKTVSRENERRDHGEKDSRSVADQALHKGMYMGKEISCWSCLLKLCDNEPFFLVLAGLIK